MSAVDTILMCHTLGRCCTQIILHVGTSVWISQLYIAIYNSLLFTQPSVSTDT